MTHEQNQSSPLPIFMEKEAESVTTVETQNTVNMDSTKIVYEETVRQIAGILGESSGSARAIIEFERQKALGRKVWFERAGKTLFVVSEKGRHGYLKSLGAKDDDAG
jgi:hypothetical protein